METTSCSGSHRGNWYNRMLPWRAIWQCVSKKISKICIPCYPMHRVQDTLPIFSRRRFITGCYTDYRIIKTARNSRLSFQANAQWHTAELVTKDSHWLDLSKWEAVALGAIEPCHFATSLMVSLADALSLFSILSSEFRFHRGASHSRIWMISRIPAELSSADVKLQHLGFCTI